MRQHTYLYFKCNGINILLKLVTCLRFYNFSRVKSRLTNSTDSLYDRRATDSLDFTQNNARLHFVKKKNLTEKYND